MHWFDVDGARDHIAGGRERRPSRKRIYAMVKDGMRVVPIGESGRRMLFCAEWIDEYLIRLASAGGPRPLRAASTRDDDAA